MNHVHAETRDFRAHHNELLTAIYNHPNIYYLNRTKEDTAIFVKLCKFECDLGDQVKNNKYGREHRSDLWTGWLPMIPTTYMENKKPFFAEEFDWDAQ